MIINCDKISKKKIREIKKRIRKNKMKLRLDIIYIGKNKASDLYIKNKMKIADSIGVRVNLHKFKKDVFFEIIKAVCNNLNFDPNCIGYFFQLPVPEHLAEQNILDYMKSSKDIDCLTSKSLGKVLKNQKNAIKPATVEAIIAILKEIKTSIKSKRISIVNDSNLIGKPLAMYLLGQGATVTICNEFTKNLEDLTKQADILITAVGKPKLIKEDMVKSDSIIIDAGISKSKGKVVGDTDFDKVRKKAKAITPVPKGVGPLTIAYLFDNLIKIYEKQSK